MKKNKKSFLSSIQNQAITELKQLLFEKFNIVNIILFGSTVHSESSSESDIDILIITPKPFSRVERHKITDLVFEINLVHDTNFSTLVIDNDSWENGPISILPIHDEIVRNGVEI